MAMSAITGIAIALLLRTFAVALPAEPHYFEQLRDHFSTSPATFSQRYYMNDTSFQGPGSPIFVIMGGEGGISPETGIFYPWITDILAQEYGALVIEPEHRFYGESLPFGNDSFTLENLHLMNSQQALADAAYFIQAQQRLRNCTERGAAGYCPVLTIGGSYPGFLSAMMRLRYPAVVDMAYAASAPMKFYSQQVEQNEYYSKVTESAERSKRGCANAVLTAFNQVKQFFEHATIEDAVRQFSLCPFSYVSHKPRDVFDDITFLAEQTFANLNMANYPPDNQTGLHLTCSAFVAAASRGGSALLEAVRELLLKYTAPFKSRHKSGRTLLQQTPPFPQKPFSCFDLEAHLPAGREARARCGDWSGCGVGRDGEMWDYQTCTFEVERIGFNNKSQMFPTRPWTMEWLNDHCAKRFGLKPRPKSLVDLWGFDAEGLRAQTSRIVFTNGLNDGWSVGGILKDIAPEKGLISINLPNGAHHSDLSHVLLGKEDTPDVQEAHGQISSLVGRWIKEVRGEAGSVFM